MSHRRSRDDNHAADAGSRHSQRRPASIGELAEKALDIDWDPSREFKHCLRMAERARNQARTSLEQGDLEMSFMLFARAATIALDKLPTHPNYTTSLTELQRHNLGLNGQEILDHMSRIKPELVTRFNEWRAEHPDDELVPLERLDRPTEHRDRDPERALADEAARWRQLSDERQRQEEEVRAQRQSTRHQHPSHSQYPIQPAFPDRRKEEIINSARQASATPVYKPPVPDYSFSRPPNHAHGSQSTIVVMPGVNDAGESPVRKRERDDKRRLEAEGIARRQQEADAEARNIRQAIAVNNTLPHGPQMQGQSISTHSSASSVATNGSSSVFPHTQASSLATTPASSFYSQQQQQPPPPPPMVHQPPPAQISPVTLTPVRGPPPPSHTYIPTPPDQHPGNDQPGSSFLIPGTSPADLNRTPTRATLRGYTSMTPITTTSPPPHDPRALFPSLMSPHQQRQGYYPSSSSMFIFMDRLTLNDTTNLPQPPPTSFNYPNNPQPIYGSISSGMTPAAAAAATTNPAAAGWTFGSQESTKSAAAAAAAQVGQRLMDGNGKLKKSKYNSPAPLPVSAPAALPPPPPPPLQQQQQQPQPEGSNSSGNNPNMKLPYIPMPPPPLSALAAGGKIPIMSGPHLERRGSSNPSNTAAHHPGPTPKERKLKTVVLPRETLPRFLAIAKLNTSMNRETCGLLLGREVWPEEESPPSYAHNPTTRGRSSGRDMLSNVGEGGAGTGVGRSEFVVTTLLIPKQRGSSDMCTMDEEELVLSFTEERSLITLGWIHTHPSQSCFMSSVDLHTHSGFQRMLPESVAVVCAPKSNPNFGIFRLTDPPGLNTILDCKEKEAFHPHPDLPIYTDADKGHVQMKDAPLEIVDLRS